MEPLLFAYDDAGGMDMAYQVQYGVSRHDRSNGGVGKWIAMTLLVILVAGLLVAGQNMSWNWLLPGDPRITAAALETLRENLTAGETLSDAVTAFCREIIHGASLSY